MRVLVIKLVGQNYTTGSKERARRDANVPRTVASAMPLSYESVAGVRAWRGLATRADARAAWLCDGQWSFALQVAHMRTDWRTAGSFGLEPDLECLS